VSSINYTAIKGRMIIKTDLERMSKEAIVKENHKKLQSG
jgi:hypothetical protein